MDKFIYQLWLCLQSAQTQLVNICQGEPPDKDRERQTERDIETDRDRETMQCNAMHCNAVHNWTNVSPRVSVLWPVSRGGHVATL